MAGPSCCSVWHGERGCDPGGIQVGRGGGHCSSLHVLLLQHGCCAVLGFALPLHQTLPPPHPAPPCPGVCPSLECSEALAPLTRLQALGLSHNLLDSWPTAIEALAPSLRVVYLEQNPGMARLPPSAAAVLSQLCILSVDCRWAGAAGAAAVALGGGAACCMRLPTGACRACTGACSKRAPLLRLPRRALGAFSPPAFHILAPCAPAACSSAMLPCLPLRPRAWSTCLSAAAG